VESAAAHPGDAFDDGELYLSVGVPDAVRDLQRLPKDAAFQRVWDGSSSPGIPASDYASQTRSQSDFTVEID